MTRHQRIIARAEALQCQGKIGDSIKLRILAGQKIVLGPEVVHER